MTQHDGHGDRGGHAHHGAGTAPGGLMIAEHGYALAPAKTVLDAGRATVRFRIIGPDGRAVTGYRPTHDAPMHFFAVNRDLSGFQHLHPTMDADGIWEIEVDLTPGVWRLLADFDPGGHGAMTLGADVFVPGQHAPHPIPPISTTATVDDYTVTLAGTLVAGRAEELVLSVARGGAPVTDLEPYLGAYGHLVALRAGDLAYLHVHPEGEPGDAATAPGPDIGFHAAAPSAGTYRLYLDFRHDGVVRTAEFTVVAGVAAGHGGLGTA